jgi:short-subunit dehydrogenase
MTGKKVIIIGATSGIGRELALIFSANGFEVGITGRRKELLADLSANLKCKNYSSAFDVRDTSLAIECLEKLIEQMGGADIIIINAGTGSINENLEWLPEKETIETNVLGFTAMADASMAYFIKQKSGHLVGVSSIAGMMANNRAPAYSSSKAYISLYLQSLRGKAQKAGIPVFVTDIIPGFVRTQMAQGEGLFWVASPSDAAFQIYKAIIHRKKKSYITKRWRIIALLIKLLPKGLLAKL